MSKNHTSVVHFHLNHMDMLRLMGLILILPATAMSISFLMEGHTPPLVGITLFVSGLFFLGYRSHLFFDINDKCAIIEKRIWGLVFSSHHISAKEITALSAYRSTYNSVRWEKNHHTDQYEAHETGQTHTETRFLMHRKDKKDFLIPQNDMSVADLRQLSRNFNIRFYSPGQKPPASKPKKSIPWLLFLFISFVLVVIANISHGEWSKYVVYEEAKEAAQELGIHVEPNMPDEKLPKDTWIIVYVKESQKWEAALITIDNYPRRNSAFIRYMLNGEVRENTLSRDIMRKYEEF